MTSPCPLRVTAFLIASMVALGCGDERAKTSAAPAANAGSGGASAAPGSDARAGAPPAPASSAMACDPKDIGTICPWERADVVVPPPPWRASDVVTPARADVAQCDPREFASTECPVMPATYTTTP